MVIDRRVEARSRAFKRADSLRALWNDTAPAELPLFITNRGLHGNLKRMGLTDADKLEAACRETNPSDEDEWISTLISMLVVTSSRQSDKGEIPVHLCVTNSEGKKRTVSLPHLRSQVRFALFLHNNAERLIECASKSPATLRAPSAIGPDRVSDGASSEDSPEGPLSERAQWGDSISAETEPSASYWPKRFFLYRGFDALWRFLESDLFIRNEERFSHLLVTDVQAAFPSIYTHSITWALRGKRHEKSHMTERPRNGRGANPRPPLGTSFDQVMQRSNWNETSGIIIGPEISRIFAEIIFQRIDLNIIQELKLRTDPTRPEQNQQRFTMFRYVDNYYVFCNTDADTELAAEVIQRHLGDFNLRLNSAKTKILRRPFIDVRGVQSQQIGNTIDQHLKQLDEIVEVAKKNIEARDSQSTASYLPLAFRNWRRRFLKDTRAICASSGGLSLAVSRVPAALRDKSFQLMNARKVAPWPGSRFLAWNLFDLAGYFLSVRPTDATGVAFCVTLLAALDSLKDEVHMAFHLWEYERLYERCLEVLENTHTFSHSLSGNNPQGVATYDNNVLLAGNILASMTKFPKPFHLDGDEAERLLQLDTKKYTADDYVAVISYAYYFHQTRQSIPRDDHIVARLRDLLKAEGTRHAGPTHLSLDLLACPSISVTLRSQLLESFRKAVEAPASYIRTNSQKRKVLDRIQQHPWFTTWTEDISILQQFRRRIRRQVY